uniref:Uncharacterized protein n=1 Tax=uncultured bacterium A1Q1_fos_1815 TaxID=1256553 RepID=L7VVQ4_9BACT|nr:hypothetical protein [uncultured bacterium A1Q1_fos_1815]
MLNQTIELLAQCLENPGGLGAEPPVIETEEEMLTLPFD